MRNRYPILSLVVAVGLALGIAIVHVIYWSYTPITIARPVEIRLEREQRLAVLSSELAHKKLIDSKTYFYMWVKHLGKYRNFQAGRYRFSGQVSPRDITASMLAGREYNPLTLELIIPEGFTLKQIEAKLVRFGVAKEGEVLALRKDKALLEHLGVPCLEGFLYPATYSFFGELPGVKELVARGVQEFFEKMPEGYFESIAALGLDLKRAVTFASLIERETSWAEERPKVSEVIWNRLKRRMPLGIDAALIYGIADYRGNITAAHLRDRSNLYNTRLRVGLPPTPIGSPSRDSLEAVLHPSSHGYFYFVAKANAERKHHFSKTLKEHNRYVKELVRYQKSLR